MWFILKPFPKTDRIVRVPCEPCCKHASKQSNASEARDIVARSNGLLKKGNVSGGFGIRRCEQSDSYRIAHSSFFCFFRLAFPLGAGAFLAPRQRSAVSNTKDRMASQLFGCIALKNRCNVVEPSS